MFNNIHIIVITEGEQREGDQKCIWENYGRKHPKPETGNRYPGTRKTEGPKQDLARDPH